MTVSTSETRYTCIEMGEYIYKKSFLACAHGHMLNTKIYEIGWF